MPTNPENKNYSSEEINQLVQKMDEDGLTPDWELFYDTGELVGNRRGILANGGIKPYDALDGLTPEEKEAIEVEGF